MTSYFQRLSDIISISKDDLTQVFSTLDTNQNGLLSLQDFTQGMGNYLFK